MKNLIFLIVCLFGLNCFSQTDLDKAKAYYFQAEEQLSQGNFEKAIEYLDQSVSLIGNTNGSIEALRAKAYYKAENFVKAREALSNFYKYSDAAPQDLLNEMSTLVVNIEDAERQLVLAEEKKQNEKEEKIKRERENLINERLSYEKEVLKKYDGKEVHRLNYADNVYMKLYDKGYGVGYLLLAIKTYAFYGSNSESWANEYKYKVLELYPKFLKHFDNEYDWLNNLESNENYKIKVEEYGDWGNTIKFIPKANFSNTDFIFTHRDFAFIAEVYYNMGEFQKFEKIIESYEILNIKRVKLLNENYWPKILAITGYELGKCSVYKSYYEMLGKKTKRKNKNLIEFYENCQFN